MAVGGSRSISVVLSANVAPFVTGLGVASTATTRFATTHAASMRTAGTALAAFGAVAIAGLGVAANEAIKWETAWAGVTKTVDGSTTQMQALEDQLRSMAKTLPATHGEIAAVAEAAGQLGIARQDVAGFTKVMIDLGVSTNLTSDQAATSLARLMNIMGTAPSQVSNLGASLVALGNAGASTETDILNMATRIAGAGRTVGLTEGEVLGFANALSSLGIEAEAGGTAISTVMLKVQQATDSGGDSLTEFARVAGMSATEFKTLFERDAAGGLAAFVAGLGKADAAGENTTAIMDGLGFEGIRVTDTLRRLALNSDLLTDSLNLGNSAFEENTALVDEANKRYATTASQIQVAKNNLRDTAITIGDQLLPVISQAAEGFSKFADFVGDIPAPLLAFLTNLTGVVGGLALLGGGLLLVVPQLAATITAFQALAVAAPRTASALGKVGSAAGIAVILYATASAISAIHNASLEAVPGMERFAASLLEVKAQGDLTALNQMFKDLDDGKTEVDSFAEAVRRLTDKNLGENISDWSEDLVHMTGDSDQAAEAIGNIDAALAQMVASGDRAGADSVFAALNAELGGTAESAETLMGLLPSFSDSLAGADNAAANAASSTEAMALGVAGVVQTSEEAEEALNALSKALDAIFTNAFSVEEATDALSQKLLDMAAAAKENGTSLDANTEVGLANREMLRGNVDAALGVIDAMAKQGASSEVLSGKTSALRKQLYDAAIAAGFSKAEAERYASALDNVPAVVATTITTPGMAGAIANADTLISRLQRLDGKQVVTTITTHNVTTGRTNRTQTRLEVDGGVLSFYADGAHVAQIAPAGAWRVWAEDETGGEAYIPLGLSKRSRSVAITEKVADRFGYQLVPKQPVQYLAMGGISGGAMPAASVSSQEHLHFHLDSAAAARQAADYIREANAAQRRRESLRSRVRS